MANMYDDGFDDILIDDILSKVGELRKDKKAFRQIGRKKKTSTPYVSLATKRKQQESKKKKSEEIIALKDSNKLETCDIPIEVKIEKKKEITQESSSRTPVILSTPTSSLTISPTIINPKIYAIEKSSPSPPSPSTRKNVDIKKESEDSIILHLSSNVNNRIISQPKKIIVDDPLRIEREVNERLLRLKDYLQVVKIYYAQKGIKFNSPAATSANIQKDAMSQQRSGMSMKDKDGEEWYYPDGYQEDVGKLVANNNSDFFP